MSRSFALIAAALIAVTSNQSRAASDALSPSPRHPAASDTYTITSTLQLVPPFNLADMNDDFQDARVLTQDQDSAIVEITYYPLFHPPIGENAHWRAEDATMTECLRSTPTENWDDTMRRDLLAELRAAGIDPDRLTDKRLVEQVSRWAMKRARSTDAFAIWTVYFPDGKPTVFPALRDKFDKERRDPAWTDEQMIGQEVLGRSMFYEKVHGACTSSSIYLTTIFRALGIPTRIVICIPPFDPNDGGQAELFYGAVHHHGVRQTVRTALDGVRGFVDHMFNEVYIDHHWVRLNYTNLGQPIVDAHYFGLLTHIATCANLSQVPLTQTWGMRFFKYPGGQPRLSSLNPYRLLLVHDQFGANAHVDNPMVAPPPELTTATIIALLRPDSPVLPAFVMAGAKPGAKQPDFFISYQEWLPGTYRQMRVFAEKVGREFVLSADGHPDLRARLSGLNVSQGDGRFQAFGAEVVATDREKIAPGVAYVLKPINTSATYRWRLDENLQPITLKD
jgi:hypothetical protein